MIYDSFEDTQMRPNLETRLRHLCPSEFILPESNGRLCPLGDMVLLSSFACAEMGASLSKDTTRVLQATIERKGDSNDGVRVEYRPLKEWNVQRATNCVTDFCKVSS